MLHCCCRNELTYKVDDLTAQLRTAREYVCLSRICNSCVQHCFVAREKLITLSSLQTLEVANGQLTNKVSSVVQIGIV